ncbi:PREDICTED: pleckstrin homology domain-containing family M member 3-like [Priapulus caudatus]|uniref:Pleckstrin homology domain-containing family M member 3-like n=1 Tax=Priapulus caudatus TaxID=37621 RepID=A0ABM1EJH8_PRICU|nr:PREDICTED: pleckstrin homology domain-containing family M member 3-like [Priapulus caudatus]
MGCSRPIGMIYGKARVCAFDGAYYCYECHENDENVIPARIIHNWDFRKHKVAKYTKLLLDRIQEEPLFDLGRLNPSIYGVVSEMHDILALRRRLNFLKTYLFTCKQSVADELRKQVWPREYLYENVHLYSTSELLQVESGLLQQTLRRLVAYCMKHVSTCPLCTQKGFICEICHNPKVIFPFEVSTTYRCDKCQTVFHSDCMNELKPCPKCERRKKRQQNVDTIDYAYVPDSEA